jgi:hypothetical protein
MALGSTVPLTEISTRNISCRLKVAVCRVDILPLSCADNLEIWEPQPGTVRAYAGITYYAFFTKDRLLHNPQCVNYVLLGHAV